MRKLIVVSHDIYVRNLVSSGALERIWDDDTWVLAGPLRDDSELAARPNYLGRLEYPMRRTLRYMRLRDVMLVSLRNRSRTQQIKLSFRRPLARAALKIAALPVVRRLVVGAILRRSGELPGLREAIEQVRPDLIVIPTGGTDPLVIDTLRLARRMEIRTLALIYNWDNLSSKGVFPDLPDHLGVVGEQSVAHAQRIHDVPPERVTVLGSPYIDNYFQHEPGSTERPFPFRFVLFAGCYMPFDELTSLRLLERVIEDEGLDLKIVYRPHPHRQPRLRPDFFDETAFRHVVLDPQVRDLYLASFDRSPAEMSSLPMPALDYYPALLEHSEFVICPLSTMVVESAVFERRVLVIAYNDGLHKTSPGILLDYDHFAGMDAVSGFELCRTQDDLPVKLLAMIRGAGQPGRPLREQIKPWLYFDARTYAERLEELVARLGDGDARTATPALVTPKSA